MSVSMPYFGLLPFLQMFRITYGSEYMVSMPYFGLLPFLPLSKMVENWNRRMFQCPTSGFFLFYYDYSGLASTIANMFQCPTSGFFLFYVRRYPTIRSK